VERCHRIDAEEFYQLLDGVVLNDAKVFNDKLQEWEDYNYYIDPNGPSPAASLSSGTRVDRAVPDGSALTPPATSGRWSSRSRS
jgi:hypothetical protein